VFSHQSASHLLANMVVLWIVGVRLHDDVGRANFMAIYLSSGAVGSVLSLASYALRKNFVTSSVGASGAIYGILTAWLWLHRWESFKPFGYPPDPYPGIMGAPLLAIIVGMEMLSLRLSSKVVSGLVDHYAHIGGYITGFVGISALERYTPLKERMERDNKRRQSVQSREDLMKKTKAEERKEASQKRE